MLHIASVLTPDEVAEVRGRIGAADWVDGRATAGHLSAEVKRNRQLAEDDPATLEAAAVVRAALARSGVFASAALPARIAPPLFNRHGIGEHYGEHIDSAIRPVAGTTMRLDLSATLFLSDPAEYTGGELVIRSPTGSEAFKLDAGDLLLYASGAIHQVAPVTSGQREACFFWVQSHVRDSSQRKILFELDAVIASLRTENVCQKSILLLTAQYHDLLRMWS
jgi:PKHD-type hydroxylase